MVVYEDVIVRFITNLNDFRNSITRIGFGMKSLFNNMTEGMTKFNMAALSGMFFMMALNRMFKSLLQPAFELTGVFDMLNIALTIFFLPVALQILDWVTQFTLWMMSLSPETQKFIGWLVFFGLIITGIGAAVFSFILGMTGMIWAFNIVSGIISFVAGLFGAALLPAILLIIALVISFKKAWEENFGGIRDYVQMIWDGVKDIFDGIKKVVQGVIDVIVGLFSGDKERVYEGVREIVFGIIKIFLGLVEAVVGIFGTIILTIFRMFKGIYTVIKDIFIDIGNWIIDNVLNPLIDAANTLINKIKPSLGQIPRISRMLTSAELEGQRYALGAYAGILQPFYGGKSQALDTGMSVGQVYNNVTINVETGKEDEEALVQKIKDTLSSDWVDELERKYARTR